MDDQPVITVRGAAVLEVEPELAVLRVVVRAQDRRREVALAAVQQRAEQVTRVLRELGPALERLETSTLQLHPQLKPGRPDERVLGYAAQLRSTATLCDFEQLGALVVRLATVDQTTIEALWWALRPDSPVHQEARLRAAQDALRRAAGYAQALGGQLSGLLELADQGLLADHEPRARGHFAAPLAMASAAGVGPTPAALELEPARQTVHAAVEARFTMTAPTLLSAAGPPAAATT
ncbi:MAG TPA: SIMPL domain-containing protein [Candidatus Dormibacteraeota bacterium]|nr:SIMPL domain-containing protein [Candidatus Dormibacteraeota bacterium]